MVLVHVVAVWKTYFSSSKYFFETFGNIVVITSGGIVLLFFVSGMYTKKIKAPDTYMARMNHSLRMFQIRFSVEKMKLVRLRRVAQQRHALPTADDNAMYARYSRGVQIVPTRNARRDDDHHNDGDDEYEDLKQRPIRRIDRMRF